MYLVPEEGETGSFLEYVYTGDKWELLGRSSSKTRGVLTMIESDGTKKFNGNTDISVDLSKYAKKDEILKQDLSVMYMNKLGESYYYDADGVMRYSGLTIKSRNNGSFGDGSPNGLNIGLGRNSNNISITEKGVYFSIDYAATWRLNPLVLAVRITHNNDYTYTTKALYDPYLLSQYNFSTTYNPEEFRYTMKHNLVSSGVVKKASNYSVMGSVSRFQRPSEAYVSTVSLLPNSVIFEVEFRAADITFDYCDLFFYDFSTY